MKPVKKGPRSLPPRLPSVEWDFSRVPESEIVACFWWEYCRASEGVRRAVDDARRSGTDFCRSVQASILTPQGIDWMAFAPVGTTSRAFPFLAWDQLDFRVNDRRGTVDHRAAWIDGFLAWRPVPLRARTDAFMVLGQEIVSQEPGHVTVRPPVLGGTTGLLGNTRASALVTVDWRFTDEQIVEAFRADVLSKRPKDRPNAKRRTRFSTAAGEIMRVNPELALKWLGVYRRRCSVASWREFGTVYPEEETESGELSRMHTYAARVIQWLNTGRARRLKDATLPRVAAWVPEVRAGTKS